MALTNQEAKQVYRALRLMVEEFKATTDVDFMDAQEQLAAKARLEQFLTILKDALTKV